MWCELTWQEAEQAFGLPVKRIFKRPLPVVDRNGIQHPSDVFRRWPDNRLTAIGFARFEETRIPRNQVSNGLTDIFDGDRHRVVRSHDLVPKPVPPADPVTEARKELAELDRFLRRDVEELADAASLTLSPFLETKRARKAELRQILAEQTPPD
ncbi:hypothetical protein [Magnetospira sp. QH-2]|uniref:hypothetical protein n=1 Tax=Magnetospira sp. (strain QH-2) TaxID=1288970 RepID=UPI0003E8135B|nr:hypothetical protein [Magnetospira sp. QH-2]CCQ72320.1 protein of unknown function [Magnetospira sp. QH-2]